MAAAFQELNVRLSARRWPCVLDPALALSRHGLVLARQVGEVAQLWLVREFWHILDSSEFFAEHPEALTADQRAAQKLKWALREWERVRMESDLAGLKLYWIGDGPAECVLPEGSDAHLLQAYEALAGALNRRMRSTAPMLAAMRDAAALAAALGATLVLSLVPKEEDRPPICSALQDWDIPCVQVDAADPIAAIEGDHLRHLLVHSGLGHLVWSGLRLAVVRLLLPNAPLCMPAAPPPVLDDELAVGDSITGPAEAHPDPWEAAQAFWHSL
jgi:hypothetical protein